VNRLFQWRPLWSCQKLRNKCISWAWRGISLLWMKGQ